MSFLVFIYKKNTLAASCFAPKTKVLAREISPATRPKVVQGAWTFSPEHVHGMFDSVSVACFYNLCSFLDILMVGFEFE